MQTNIDLLKQRFFKIFANLPVGMRREIVINLEEVGAMTWNACNLEVENNTPLAVKILENLEEMQII